MLEPKTLKRIPVPDLEQVPYGVRRQLLNLVDQRLLTSASSQEAIQLEKQIDEIVADLYELPSHERRTIGME